MRSALPRSIPASSMAFASVSLPLMQPTVPNAHAWYVEGPTPSS
jgi:hypothetical protein